MNVIKLIVTITVFGTISSCNKDKAEFDEFPDSPYGIRDSVVIGDSVAKNIQFSNYSPHIAIESFDTMEYYDIHIDNDGIHDIRFKVYSTYVLNGTWGVGSTVKVETMNPDVEISIEPLFIDSSRVFPKRYSFNDTLFQESTWLTGEFYISENADVPNDGCSGAFCPNMYWGHWFGQSEKYLGIRLKNSEFPRLGWIKISLPSTDVNWGQKVIIEEFGYVP